MVISPLFREILDRNSVHDIVARMKLLLSKKMSHNIKALMFWLTGGLSRFRHESGKNTSQAKSSVQMCGHLSKSFTLPHYIFVSFCLVPECVLKSRWQTCLLLSKLFTPYSTDNVSARKQGMRKGHDR